VCPPGYGFLTNALDCQNAAQSLHWNVTNALDYQGTKDSSVFPRGCFFWQRNGVAHFNADPVGMTYFASNGVGVPICAKAPCSTHSDCDSGMVCGSDGYCQAVAVATRKLSGLGESCDFACNVEGSVCTSAWPSNQTDFESIASSLGQACAFFARGAANFNPSFYNDNSACYWHSDNPSCSYAGNVVMRFCPCQACSSSTSLSSCPSGCTWTGSACTTAPTTLPPATPAPTLSINPIG